MPINDRYSNIPGFLFAFIALVLLATPSKASAEQGEDSTIYIRKYHDFSYVKLLTSDKLLSLGFRDKENPNAPEAIFEPNVGNFVGIGFFLFDVGIEAMFRIRPGPEQNALYGPSDGTDWQIHAYARSFGLDLSYQHYKGFYLSNPELFYPNYKSGDPYPRKPDMEAQVINLSGHYVFRKKRFSFPNVFNQTERQMKSGGSLMISGQFNHSNITDPGSLILITDSNTITSLTEIRNINVSSFNAMPGYSYNLIIFKKLYLNLSLSVGLGYQFRNYQAEGQPYRDNKVVLANSWRAGFGYNGRKFFWGISGYTQSNQIPIQNLEIRSETGFIKVFLGYRFRRYGALNRSAFELLKYVPFIKTKYKDNDE